MKKSTNTIGRCVYCDEVHENLSREHVIPFGIGGLTDRKGNLATLKRACCPTCKKIVDSFEDFVQRKAFGMIRTMSGIRSGYRRKELRPDTLPLTLNRHTHVLVERSKHPGLFALPVFDPPAILSGQPFIPGKSQMRGFTPVDLIGVKERSRRLKEYWGDEGSEVYVPALVFEPATYARFVAKIAHCYAILRLGYNTFTPFLRELILGRDDRAQFFVGNPEGAYTPKRSTVHSCGVAFHRAVEPNLVVVTVQLFGKYDTLPYWAVVGEISRSDQGVEPPTHLDDE